ncbi:MAG: hypothetical protein FWD09_02350 [Lentimicrobiaceae bacterium]|nr:hypothetical protein [Lentimicrobiaceae bacterium]
MNPGLGELKKFLPHNYRKQIAEATGYSRSYVYMVATGRLTNWNMLDSLRQLAAKNRDISNKVIIDNKKIRK